MERRPLLLFIEDNPLQQKVLRALCDELGFASVCVSNASEALSVVESGNYCFDVILTDISMPDMDGITCAKQLRTMQEQVGVFTPIIAVTAHALRGDRERFLEAGIDDYLSKPHSVDQFNCTISRWIPDLESDFTRARVS
jgi:CheY-like chemotaxis protein